MRGGGHPTTKHITYLLGTGVFVGLGVYHFGPALQLVPLCVGITATNFTTVWDLHSLPHLSLPSLAGCELAFMK